MGCCGRRRTSRRARPAAPPLVAAPRAAALGTAARTSNSTSTEPQLRFVGSGRIRVEGATSGRVYRASRAERLVRVDPLDRSSMLRTGLFVPGDPPASGPGR